MSDGHQQPGARPLHRVIPRLSELRANPHHFLTQQEVRIGRARPSPGIFLLVPFLAALGYYLHPHPWGIPLMITAPAMLAFCCAWTWPTPRSVVLRAHGVEFHVRDHCVWCPWALFSAPGQPLITKPGFVGYDVMVPVLVGAIPEVQHRVDGRVVATGRAAETPYFRFHGADEVVFASYLEAYPNDLAALLLELGAMLAGPLTGPADTAPQPDAIARTRLPPTPAVSRSLPSPIRDDSEGWLTVPITRFQFPLRCCRCCAFATHWTRVEIGAGASCLHFVPMLGHMVSERSVELSIPFCAPCRRRQWGRSAALFAGQMALGLAPLGLIYLIAYGHFDVCLGLILIGIAIVAGRVLHFISANPFAARYVPDRQCIDIRFATPAYRLFFLEHLESVGDSP